ncbi:MAG: lysoplasmalogenase family protein [Sediminibacterium sp.]
MVTKSLLLPLVLGYLLLSIGKKGFSQSTGRWAIAALLFSWGGDLLLMGDGTLLFLTGMICFMLTHLCNIRILTKAHTFRWNVNTLSGTLISLFAVGIFYYLMKDKLGSFLLQVVIYMTLIAVSWALSFNLLNHDQLKRTAATFIIPGIGLFILSDALLAYNKFFQLSSILIDMMVMVTYGLAQWIITEGYILLIDSKEEK